MDIDSRPQPEKQIKNAKRSKSIAIALWIANFVVVGLIMIVGALVYNGHVGYMPPVEGLMNPEDKYASRLFTSDGVEMGRFYQNKNNRVYADYDEISPNVINALIATEDIRFKRHSGIDLRALTRVLAKTTNISNNLQKHTPAKLSTISFSVTDTSCSTSPLEKKAA